MSGHVATVPTQNAAGVTDRVSVRLLGRAARDEDDARVQVTLMLSEFSPWALRFDFLRCVVVNDEDSTDRRIVLDFLGYALERPLLLREAKSALSRGEDVQLSAERIDLLHRYFWSYKRIAELRAQFQDETAVEHHRKVVDDIRSGVPLYRDLPFLVDRFRSHAGSESGQIWATVDEFGCSRKTVWQYLERAREAGLIGADELPPRRR
jgi:hypothetical protein